MLSRTVWRHSITIDATIGPSQPSANTSIGSEDVARQATQPVDYPIILTDELHEKSDKMVVTIKEHLKRDLKFQKLMREVEIVVARQVMMTRLITRKHTYQRNEYKKSCLTKTPSKDTAVKIYFENQLSMWPDLHFHDDQTEKWWLQKCDVPCKWTTNRDEADVLVHFWFK